MCDYSLCELRNRLAIENEELVTYRFPTYSIGLASPGDPGTAVCIPPGARHVLSRIPFYLQTIWNIGEQEPVVFTQLSLEANRHRDAIRFSNGHEVLLQNLPEEVRVKVVSLGTEASDVVETGSANADLETARVLS